MNQSNNAGIYILTAALSLLLSVYAIVSNPVLSSDSVLYLRTAEAFVTGGVPAALELYSWPALSILIALFHKLSGLSYEWSAYLLSSGFYILICCAFVSLVRRLGGLGKVQWIAAFVILSYPTLNDYRDYIIRDHGFWALLLVSLIWLLRFQEAGGARNAVAWVLCVIAAFAFRIEALVFLLLGPLLLLVTEKRPLSARLRKAGILSLTMLAISTTLLVAAVAALDLLTIDLLWQKFMVIPLWLSETIGNLVSTSEVINQALENPYIADDMNLLLVSGLLMLLVFQGLHALLPNNLILLIWGRGLLRNPFVDNGQTVILGHLLVIFLYLVFAIISKQFINDRFMVPLCLMLLLWLPFYAGAIIDQYYQQKIRWSPVLLLGLLGYSLLDTLISTGTTKQHIEDAVVWINQNTRQESKLLTNNAHIAYFSHQAFDECAYSLNPARAYYRKSCPGRNLLVIEMKEKDRDLAKRLKSLQRYKGFRVINRFSNERQDQIVILQAGE